jgi:hypothetical protein
VGLDDHVEIEEHYYSVPHQLLHETVWDALPHERLKSSAAASALPPTCARLPIASIRQYRTPRRLGKALFQQLATYRWIVEHHGL